MGVYGYSTLYYTSNMKPSRWIRRCHASWFTCFTIVGRNRFVEKRAAAPVAYIVRKSVWQEWWICYVVSFDGLCKSVKDFGWSKDIRNYSLAHKHVHVHMPLKSAICSWNPHISFASRQIIIGTLYTEMDLSQSHPKITAGRFLPILFKMYFT